MSCPKQILTDARVESIRQRVNSAIHELVFAVQHADQDDVEDACNCLMTAQGTLEEVATELAALADTDTHSTP